MQNDDSVTPLTGELRQRCPRFGSTHDIWENSRIIYFLKHAEVYIDPHPPSLRDLDHCLPKTFPRPETHHLQVSDSNVPIQRAELKGSINHERSPNLNWGGATPL